MSQEYSNPKRATYPHSLPDVEVFQLTAVEAAAREGMEDAEEDEDADDWPDAREEGKRWL